MGRCIDCTHDYANDKSVSYLAREDVVPQVHFGVTIPQIKRPWSAAADAAREFETLGFDTGESESPVIPLVVGEDLDAYSMTMKLQDRGVFANPVVSPAVPKGRSMMRTSYMATHTMEQLEFALEAIAAVGREMGIIR